MDAGADGSLSEGSASSSSQVTVREGAIQAFVARFDGERALSVRQVEAISSLVAQLLKTARERAEATGDEVEEVVEELTKGLMASLEG